MKNLYLYVSIPNYSMVFTGSGANKLKKEKDEVLELRLFGDGIRPEIFKAREVGVLFASLEEALKQYIAANDKGVDIESLFLSPIGIGNDSLGLKFHPNVTKYFVGAFTAVSSAIASNNISSLPAKSADHVYSIQKIARAKNCSAEFKRNGEILAEITPNSEIKLSLDIIKTETIIYGSVQKVGGEEPTVWVTIDNGERFVLKVNREQAKDLSHRLYEEVGFRGSAVFAASDHSLIDFKVTEVIAQYNPLQLNNAFKEIRAIVGKYWDTEDDINDILLRA